MNFLINKFNVYSHEGIFTSSIYILIIMPYEHTYNLLTSYPKKNTLTNPPMSSVSVVR